ncbi:hypothetical protein DUNSADRAFT_6258, partial [Dunaliella salina]
MPYWTQEETSMLLETEVCGEQGVRCLFGREQRLDSWRATSSKNATAEAACSTASTGPPWPLACGSGICCAVAPTCCAAAPIWCTSGSLHSPRLPPSPSPAISTLPSFPTLPRLLDVPALPSAATSWSATAPKSKACSARIHRAKVRERMAHTALVARVRGWSASWAWRTCFAR